jgi:hypothetical protein
MISSAWQFQKLIGIPVRDLLPIRLRDWQLVQESTRASVGRKGMID